MECERERRTAREETRRGERKINVTCDEKREQRERMKAEDKQRNWGKCVGSMKGR